MLEVYEGRTVPWSYFGLHCLLKPQPNDATEGGSRQLATLFAPTAAPSVPKLVVRPSPYILPSCPKP